MNLPPQAYTREMLAHAYEWLKTQPGSIRELATSADDLVALYLQSRRRPKQSLSTSPVSSANFKSDLKDLAEGLKQFEGQKTSHPFENKPEPQAQPQPEPAPVIATPSPAPATISPSVPPLSFDLKTTEILRKVQNQLNLGSENEALRMLITLGYEKVREILPKS